MKPETRTNCLLYRGLKVKLYKRCAYCDHHFLDCLGTQYNIVAMITFTLLLILPSLTGLPVLFKASTLLIAGILVVLGFLVNAKTDALYLSEFDLKQKTSEMETLNRELRALNESLATRTRDLTRANEELRKLDEIKSDFLSTVSHEFRSPLTSIKAFSKILLNNHEKVREEERRGFLTIIDQESDRLTRMINDVLDLSKLEAGKMDFDMQELRLGDLLRQAAKTLAPVADHKAIRLDTVIPPNLPVILGDPDRLIQVITNLLDNAIKFTPAGGRIRIAARTGSGRIEVAVEDNGPGIPEEQIPEIFSKFKQGGGALTDKPRGTGLGLPICKEIARAHHGEIRVQSTLGKGSRFILRLPVGMEKGAAAAASFAKETTA